MKQIDSKRFFCKVLKLPSGCWIWMAALQGKYYKKENGGYGSFRLNGRIRPAHIESYVHHNGPVPEGLQIDHLCRVTLCVNPDHLEAVTSLENFKRGEAYKGTFHKSKTHCPSGHEYTEENTAIRKSYKKKSPDNTYRLCRICRLETQRKSDAKRRNKDD